MLSVTLTKQIIVVLIKQKREKKCTTQITRVSIKKFMRANKKTTVQIKSKINPAYSTNLDQTMLAKVLPVMSCRTGDLDVLAE